MDTMFLTNRAVIATGLSDLGTPGPIGWGVASCTANPTAPEGFTWAFNEGKGMKMLGKDAFLATFAAQLAPGPKPKALLVHFHGAGCMSADVFCRATNLATLYGDDDLEIVPLLVSWSSGSFSVEDYLGARRWLQRDVTGLAEAFRVVTDAVQAAREANPALRTLLTAHSLGNYLLGRILDDCMGRPDGVPALGDCPFDDTLLLAADVDDNALNVDGPPPGLSLHLLGAWTRGVHVYYSSRDSVVGLGFLGQVALSIPGRSGPALGSVGPRPSIGELPDGTPVDSINCCFLPGAMDGPTVHHYWRIDPLAIEDVKAVCRQVPPSGMPWRSRNLLDHSWNLFPSELGTPMG